MINKDFGGSWGLGALLGLQIQWSASEVDGGFDSHILPPKSSPATLLRCDVAHSLAMVAELCFTHLGGPLTSCRLYPVWSADMHPTQILPLPAYCEHFLLRTQAAGPSALTLLGLLRVDCLVM